MLATWQMCSYAAALVQLVTIHLLHMGTLQRASLSLMAASTSTFTRKIWGRQHINKMNKVRRSDSFLFVPFQEKNLQEMRTPPIPFHNTCSFFLLLLFRRAVSSLMNSKMVRFAFQSGNLPLEGDKVPPPKTQALNHIKHTAIFCEAPQQCQYGSASPSLCLLLFVGLFTS